MKTYKFRLYPNNEQNIKLQQTLDLCRFTYNHLLEELSKNKDKTHIQHYIVTLKEKYPILKNVYGKTLQYECYRLFYNLKGLSRLKKNNHKVGKLRFKGYDWFKTFSYNQYGFKLIKTEKHFDKLQLSKIGVININCHRNVKGNIKQITIKKAIDKWFAFIITDENIDRKCGSEETAFDLGINYFLVDINNNKVENPLYLKQNLQQLKHLQRELHRKKKNSMNRKKTMIKIQKLYEHIDNSKHDFFHKLTTKLITQNKWIAYENLNIKNMYKTRKNCRNILDSSWYKFTIMLNNKAESAGCKVVSVNPTYTTQECSCCYKLQKLELWQKIYICDCGNILERDHNSAKNIFRKAKSQELGFTDKRSLQDKLVNPANHLDEVKSYTLNTISVRV